MMIMMMIMIVAYLWEMRGDGHAWWKKGNYFSFRYTRQAKLIFFWDDENEVTCFEIEIEEGSRAEEREREYLFGLR
jgi:hypothetical protein